MGVTAKDLREAREWIEAVTGTQLEGTLQEALKSGVVLCNLLNKLKPGSVKPPSNKRLPFSMMENIAAYVAACKALGVAEEDLFLTADLYENHDLKAVVLNIHSLGRLSQNFFEGPTLGPKLATANHREFTDEQLNAGKYVVGGFGLGSHVSAQANAQAKLGLAPAPKLLAAEPPASDLPLPPAAPVGGGLFASWFGPPGAPPGAPPSTAEEEVHPPGMMTRTMEELVRRTSSIVLETAANEAVAEGVGSPASAKHAPDPEADARAWVEAIIGEPLAGETLHDTLKSGVAVRELRLNPTPTILAAPTTSAGQVPPNWPRRVVPMPTIPFGLSRVFSHT